MNLETQTRDGALLVTPMESRIDAAVAIQFKDSMRDATEGGPDRVVLDLSHVTFLDSSGLGSVVAAMKLLGNGRRLELAALTPTVEKVFRLTRMDSIFVIHPDRDSAFGALPEAS